MQKLIKYNIMKQFAAVFSVLTFSVLSIYAGNTGRIAKPDTNENRDSTCADGKCQKIVTHRCFCSRCDSAPTGSQCPCVQNNSGLVQQTIYPGQCVEVTASVSLGYEKEQKGFSIGAEISGTMKFCMFNSTPRTAVVTGPVCTI